MKESDYKYVALQNLPFGVIRESVYIKSGKKYVDINTKSEIPYDCHLETKFFKAVLMPKTFEINAIVTFKQNIGNDIKKGVSYKVIRNGDNYVTLNQVLIETKKPRDITVSHKEMTFAILAKKYWYISSGAKIQAAYLGIDERADAYRKLTKNVYDSNSAAWDKLASYNL